MLSKNVKKLANSFKKRLRELDIFIESKRIPNYGKINTNISVTPIKTLSNVETVVPYGEKYFEKNYGDMNKNRKKDKKVIYNAYEFYLVLEALVKYLNLGGEYRKLKILEIGCNNGYTVMLLQAKA